MTDLARYDPTREPFADGIDGRVMGRALATPPDVDPETGEVIHDRRQQGVGPDVSRAPWPPPSSGPLPPRDTLDALDLNIFTAQDEIDAWAHEHDHATETLSRLRSELAMTAPDGTDAVEILVMKARARYRRVARANPAERGRRTSADIDEEVNENLAKDANYQRKLDLETGIEIALARLFRAKDNINRLQRYIETLPRAYSGEGGR